MYQTLTKAYQCNLQTQVGKQELRISSLLHLELELFSVDSHQFYLLEDSLPGVHNHHMSDCKNETHVNVLSYEKMAIRRNFLLSKQHKKRISNLLNRVLNND